MVLISGVRERASPTTGPAQPSPAGHHVWRPARAGEEEEEEEEGRNEEEEKQEEEGRIDEEDEDDVDEKEEGEVGKGVME